MTRVRAVSALIVGLAVVMTAGCGPESDTDIPTAGGGATASPSAESDDLTAYVACVRERGVDVPDPPTDLPTGDAAKEVIHTWMQQAAASTGFDAADRACQDQLPTVAGNQDDTPSAQELEQLRTFAVCMRAHDIEMSDPTPQGDMVIGGRLEHVTRAQLEADPAYAAAIQACQDKLPVPAGTEVDGDQP